MSNSNTKTLAVESMNMPKTTPIKLSRIDLKEQAQFQMRSCGSDANTVEAYAEAWKARTQFPPIVAYTDGSSVFLAEGFHRCEAAIAAGLKTIACDLREGTQHDAFKHALGANHDHGLPRTQADKRHAIEAALEHAELRNLSDRQLAELCKVSRALVKSVRDAFEERVAHRAAKAAKTAASQVAEKPPAPIKRVGKDGRMHPARRKLKATTRRVPPAPSASASQSTLLGGNHVVTTNLSGTELLPSESGGTTEPGCKCAKCDENGVCVSCVDPPAKPAAQTPSDTPSTNPSVASPPNSKWKIEACLKSLHGMVGSWALGCPREEELNLAQGLRELAKKVEAGYWRQAANTQVTVD